MLIKATTILVLDLPIIIKPLIVASNVKELTFNLGFGICSYNLITNSSVSSYCPLLWSVYQVNCIIVFNLKVFDFIHLSWCQFLIITILSLDFTNIILSSSVYITRQLRLRRRKYCK